MGERRHCRATHTAVLHAGGLFIIAAVICGLGWGTPSAMALPGELAAEMYADGLNKPVAMAAADNGDILVAEKGGDVRLVRDRTLREAPVASFATSTGGKAGLLGIAVFADYAKTGRFAVVYVPSTDPYTVYVSRARVTANGGQITEDPWIVLPSQHDPTHNFGGDIALDANYMYLALGDLGQASDAQDTGRLAGSLLRYRADGTVPDDNPFGSPIFAYGFRTPFGLDVTADGTIWLADSGDHLHDEIDRVEAGGNYGWPLVMGRCDNYPPTEVCSGAMTDPSYEFRDKMGVTGLLAYEGELMPELAGDIFVGGRHSGEVDRFRLSDGGALEKQGAFFVADTGIRDLAQAPDGAMLVLTAGATSGSILRIAPRTSINNREAMVGDSPLPRQPDAAACAVAATAAPAPWSKLVLLLVCLGLVCWALRRRRVPRAVLLTACLLAVVTLWSAKADAAEFYWGPKVGADLATISGDNSVAASFAPGLAAGVATRFEFGHAAAISPELLYATKGSGIDGVNQRFVTHEVTLPVFLEAKLHLGWLSPRLSVAPAGSFVLDARTGDASLTDRVNRFRFSFMAGLGADIEVGSDMITVDARYEQGLTRIYNDSATPAYLSTPKNYNNVLYLMAGYLF